MSLSSPPTHPPHPVLWWSVHYTGVEVAYEACSVEDSENKVAGRVLNVDPCPQLTDKVVLKVKVRATVEQHLQVHTLYMSKTFENVDFYKK